MLKMAEDVRLTLMTEQIDELSTRLILDGVATLRSGDFQHLASLAAELGNPLTANVVREIEEGLDLASTLAGPDLTRIVSSGLVELRRLLDEPPVGSQSTSDYAVTPDLAEPLQSIVSGTQPLAADEDLIREFIAESSEHLVSIESQLLILEKDNTATDTLNAIFRGFHTIKGLAGFLEFAEILSLTHEVETLLDLARTSQLAVSPSLVDVVLESTDIVRLELARIADKLAGKTPPPTRVIPALLERVCAAAHGSSTIHESLPARSFPVQAASSTPEPCQLSPASCASEFAGVEEDGTSYHIRPERRIGDSSSVRIDTAKLDQLMDMVGEMVIAQTLIQHSSVLEAATDTTLQQNLTQLTRITADVQRIATAMRMVPIGLQFNKTARVVRDLARRAGKQVVFESFGEDTELDKTIAEQLSDPLLHMVRNSIDHGIESPEERIALGKDATARIRVSAYHQSGQIVVAIADDGRGLDREKILAKARQNGLVAPGAQLTDNEIFLLIFEAGFSTADKVTDISGRGVGMDVVRSHVQKLRGRIDIQTKAGEGTTFYIKLPLTLAIIEGLVVMVGQQRYIIPIFSVSEMFRPTQEILSTVQGKVEMALVRGGLMPIIRLHQRFRIEPRTTNLTEGTLIVAESKGRSFCLFVDEVLGKQEVVIKSLGRRFKDVIEVAGCAILGDGRVGLILDIDGIYKGRA